MHVGTRTKNFVCLSSRKTEGYSHIKILAGKENVEESKSTIGSIGVTYYARIDKIMEFLITSPTFLKNK